MRHLGVKSVGTDPVTSCFFPYRGNSPLYCTLFFVFCFLFCLFFADSVCIFLESKFKLHY